MTGFLETLINLILRIYGWFIFWEILLEFQEGVMLRLGRWNRNIGPGWNWRLPFGLEQALAVNVVPTTADLPAQAIRTSDGTQLLVETVILWGISQPKQFILEVESAVTVLGEAGSATVHEVIAHSTYQEVIGGTLNQALTKEIRLRMRKWGIKIYSVQITSLSRLGLREGCFRIAEPGQLTSSSD